MHTGLVVLSIVFLATVIVRTEAWKSSPLTLLLFDVEQEVKDLVSGQARYYRGIEKAVGKTEVRLAIKPNGLGKFKSC